MNESKPCGHSVGTSLCIEPRTVPVRSGLSGAQTADFSRPLLTSDALRTGTVRSPFARVATTLNRYLLRGGDGEENSAKLNTCFSSGRGRILSCLSAQPSAVSAQRTSRTTETCRRLFPLPVGEGQGEGYRIGVRYATLPIPETVERRNSSARGFPSE